MNFILALMCMSVCIGNVFAQSRVTNRQTESNSARLSFNIAKEVKPALWKIIDEPYFVDMDGNKAIDANENSKIVMKLKNVGTGDGMGLTAVISATGTTNGISYENKRIPNIKVGETATVEFPISTSMYTANGNVSFQVYVSEPNGFNTETYTLQILTREFQAPMIVVKDYEVTSEGQNETLKKMKNFNLQLLIQNTKYGVGEDISVTLKYPDNVVNVGGSDLVKIAQLEAGETKNLTYTLLVNALYNDTKLPLQVVIKEKYGKYSENKYINLELEQKLGNAIAVGAQIAEKKVIEDVSLRSEVDRNIPSNAKKNSHRYAIVIGNEDYHSYQVGLNSEQDVPFANGDASTFKEYCLKTLGVEQENLVFLTNATAAKMNQEIELITRIAARDKDAEIIFYYAGHGFPDEKTQTPYLIPVDVSASSLSSAIPLYDLYGKLCETGAKRVTVFLDACFSGGGRDAGLVAASRGIKVTPKRNALSGNIVIFSATSSDQTALPYAEKKHGMFTYFLLKKLQDSKGDCTYSEMAKYLDNNVGTSSLRINRKDQTPEVNTAPQVQDSWGSWKF